MGDHRRSAGASTDAENNAGCLQLWTSAGGREAEEPLGRCGGMSRRRTRSRAPKKGAAANGQTSRAGNRKAACPPYGKAATLPRWYYARPKGDDRAVWWGPDTRTYRTRASPGDGCLAGPPSPIGKLRCGLAGGRLYQVLRSPGAPESKSPSSEEELPSQPS